jgi:hypothetical protein
MRKIIGAAERHKCKVWETASFDLGSAELFPQPREGWRELNLVYRVSTPPREVTRQRKSAPRSPAFERKIKDLVAAYNESLARLGASERASKPEIVWNEKKPWNIAVRAPLDVISEIKKLL